MSIETTLLRRAQEERARRGMRRGNVTDPSHPQRPMGAEEFYWRDNGLFRDITGTSVIGFAVIGTMTT